MSKTIAVTVLFTVSDEATEDLLTCLSNDVEDAILYQVDAGGLGTDEEGVDDWIVEDGVFVP